MGPCIGHFNTTSVYYTDTNRSDTTSLSPISLILFCFQASLRWQWQAVSLLGEHLLHRPAEDKQPHPRLLAGGPRTPGLAIHQSDPGDPGLASGA